jgi:hypothetical protein
MNFQDLGSLDAETLFNNPWVLVGVAIVTLWKFSWYGLALWKTVELKKKYHFMVFFALMMVLNDLGIVPIIYLIWQKYRAKDGTDRIKKKN